MSKPREIKIRIELRRPHDGLFEFSGWLDGQNTYLWFGMNSESLGTLSGRKLYKLAQDIVKEFEKEKS